MKVFNRDTNSDQRHAIAEGDANTATTITIAADADEFWVLDHLTFSGDSDPDSDYRWIIDPIDGTAEFARHVPLYGCIIGLHYRQRPLVGVIDHRAMHLRCHGAYGLGAFANGERVRIDDWPSGRAVGGARVGMPSRASFLKPTEAGRVFSAIVDAYPNFRAYHTCYAHTLAVIGGLDAAMEWDTPLWDLGATQILIEEAPCFLGFRHRNGAFVAPEWCWRRLNHNHIAITSNRRELMGIGN